MQVIITNPELVIPWEHETVCSYNEGLEERAREEKQNPRNLGEILTDVNEYLSVSDVERDRRMWDREMKGWKYVPPVPVFDSAEDMLNIGPYIVYNGHNRRAAAKQEGILLPCILIDSQQALEFCRKLKDFPFLEAKPDFESQKFRLWEIARTYMLLKGRYR